MTELGGFVSTQKLNAEELQTEDFCDLNVP
jgi:hypothetical protein